jgi:vacuolar protein sorting-associated protein 45
LLTTNQSLWQRFEQLTYNRIIEGIISVCLANRIFPIIKTVSNSNICIGIAKQVAEFFKSNSDMIRKEIGKEQNGLLFIFDRKEDPVTPILNQWTYQAMLHELIGITNNVLEIKHKTGKPDKLVISDYDDKFFQNSLHSDFGEVCFKVKEAIEHLNREQENIDKKVDSLEEIKKMVDKLPEKKKESAEITKHTNLVYEVSEICQNRNLYDLSALEQDIACNEDKKEQFNKLAQVMKNSKYDNFDKTKLFLLFSLRYEGDGLVKSLSDIMVENGLKEWTSYYNVLQSYAGKAQRNLDVFSNKDFLAKGMKTIFQTFKNVPNVYTQHKSFLSSLLEKLWRGRVKDNEIETIYKVGEREK